MHLIKLCVGVDTLDELRAYQAMRLENARRTGAPQELVHRTRQMPKKRAEIEKSGSLYWVIKGVVRARQRILALRPEEDAEGRSLCAIVFDHALVETRPQPRRPFQGWRYLHPDDAPANLSKLESMALGDIPSEMRAALEELALL
ncbi:MAG TPA: DUF1489 domain-containing protein [Hyphomicrobiales bacterium]|nr:DUF1489 domain-containing protein [Hyphomicrobiales bacterium]